MQHPYSTIRYAVIALFLFAFTAAKAQVITTIAGNGTSGFSGDGGLADTAKLSQPGGIAIDTAGNIYIADIGANVVRKITKATGIITTVAGNNTSGYSGDYGQATAAQLAGPSAVAVDRAGNIFIADEYNYRIREVSATTGVITTLAGGSYGYAGDGQPASGGVMFTYLTGIAVDSMGNVYVADEYNNRIREYTVSNGLMNTFAGNGTGAFLGDGGVATAAELYYPTGVAVDKAGNVYVADNSNQRIRKIAKSTNIISTVAGNGTYGYTGNGGPADSAELYGPYAMTVDPSGNIYIVDASNNAIRKVGTNDTISTITGLGQYSYGYNGDHIEASSAELNYPTGVAIDSSGNIYIADQSNYRIRKVTVSGPNITTQPHDTSVCDRLGAAFSLAVSGTGNTYQWMVDTNNSANFDTIKNNSNYSGATSDTLVIKKASGKSNNYQFKCVINGGYLVSNTVYLYINALPSVTFSGPTDSICPGKSTILSASIPSAGIILPDMNPVTTHGVVSNGHTYSWSTGDTTSSITVAPTNTTTYTLALTKNGCTLDTTITVQIDHSKIYASAFPSTTICYGSSVALYGNHGSTYSWSSGVKNGTGFSPTATATYTVTGSDALGCITKDSIKIAVNPAPAVAITSSPKDTICTGMALTLTGTGANTYNWNGGVTNGVAFKPTSSGIYYVTGTDTNGCTASAQVNILVNPLPVITGSTSPASVCAGSSVTLSGNGGLTYTWSGGVTNGVPFVPFSSGSYTVTGTDINGCSNTASVGVTVNPVPAVKATAFPSATVCQGTSLALLGSGASSYAWSGGVNNGVSFTPSSSATYTVTGIDANGCTNKDSIKVSVHKKVVITLISNNTTCGLKNGTAVATGSNGVPPYTYSWSTSPVQTSASVDSLAPGTYVVTVSDSANCASTSAVSIAASTAPILSVSTTTSNCGTFGTGSASVTVTGGTSPYRYMWNNGDTLPNNYNLKAATYIITVTDVNGCSTFVPAIVTNANGPKITTNSVTNVNCNGAATGAINITVSGGTAPYLYTWSTGATTQNISGLYAGPYQLTVMDADSCLSVENFTITQSAPLALTTSAVKADCGIPDGSAAVSATGGLAPYSYAWNNATTSASNNNIMAGVYAVTVTDAHGCIDSAHIAVNTKTGPAVSLSVAANASCGSGGLITASAMGGAAPYTYMWSTGGTSTSISNVPAGNYYVVVSDTLGCIGTADTTIYEAGPPPVSICMVTVDPISNKHNIIVWDKSSAQKIAYYNIYKESTSAGVYFKIASVPFDSLGTYVDMNSDPTVRSWRYKISQVDSCGNESPLSPAHKTMHLTVNEGVGNNINLIWDNYEGLAFSTYYVYRDTINTNFTLIDSIPNNVFTYTDNKPLKTSKPLLYRIGISNPGGCTPAIESINYHSSKSNTGNLTFNPLGVASVSDGFNSLSIFPNPSTGVFTVSMDLPLTAQNLSMKVYNALGQVVVSQSYPKASGAFSKKLDLSTLSKGVYFIKLASDNAVAYRKLVIQ